jgi:hypothetical protein
MRYDARSLEMCNILELNILEFWQECRIPPAVAINHAAEIRACFTRRWRSVPEGLMDFARECLDEREQTRRRMQGL